MARPRFTIRSLLLAVLFVGIAAAALRASTDAWDGGLFGMVFLILLTAVLLAFHRADHKRAYWSGFALFGWAYLVASLVPQVESRLPTTKGLAYIDSKIPGRETTLTVALNSIKRINSNAGQAVAFSPDGGTLAISSPAIRLWDATTGKLLAGPGGTSENFVRIGHSLLALVVAFLGGHLSRSLHGHDRGERPNLPGDTPVSVRA
jgi:hypothetical protein